MDLVEYLDDVSGLLNKPRHPWELARFEVAHDIIAQHLSNTDNLLLMDIGCGDTYFIEKTARRLTNARVAGVDIAFTDETVNKLNSLYAQAGQTLTLFKNLDDCAKAYHNQKADVVFLMDVIEHIEYDISFLKNLLAQPFIGPNTMFLITVPAFQGLFSAHDVFLLHYRRYTKKMLRNHTQQAGLQTQTSGYFFVLLLLIRILQKTKEVLTKPNKQKGIGQWKGGPAKTKLLVNTLIADYKLGKLLRKMGLTLPGLSCFMVGKPK